MLTFRRILFFFINQFLLFVIGAYFQFSLTGMLLSFVIRGLLFVIHAYFLSSVANFLSSCANFHHLLLTLRHLVLTFHHLVLNFCHLVLTFRHLLLTSCHPLHTFCCTLLTFRHLLLTFRCPLHTFRCRCILFVIRCLLFVRRLLPRCVAFIVAVGGGGGCVLVRLLVDITLKQTQVWPQMKRRYQHHYRKSQPDPSWFTFRSFQLRSLSKLSTIVKKTIPVIFFCFFWLLSKCTKKRHVRIPVAMNSEG